MKTLERNRIDGMVREVETGAYRLALALVEEPASAERIVLRAFASLAPSLARVGGTIELREKLYARIRQRAGQQKPAAITDVRSDPAAAVSESLFMGIGTNEVALLEWQTGKILWRQPGDPSTDGFRPVFAIPQPNGPAMAIAVGAQPRIGDVDQLWPVAADRLATQLIRCSIRRSAPASELAGR